MDAAFDGAELRHRREGCGEGFSPGLSADGSWFRIGSWTATGPHPSPGVGVRPSCRKVYSFVWQRVSIGSTTPPLKPG